MTMKCGVEKMENGKAHTCGEPASWLHPRWAVPICDKHKATHEQFSSEGWVKVPGMEYETIAALFLNTHKLLTFENRELDKANCTALSKTLKNWYETGYVEGFMEAHK